VLLIVLDIWVCLPPLLLLIGAAVLAALLALRNVAPNLAAGFQLSATQPIKIGDYVKLETGRKVTLLI